jgi:Cu/Ag efflux protein CusF
MRTFYWFVLFVLAIPVVLVGCKGSESRAPAGKQYSIKGQVVAVDSDKPSVRLNHEDIPGLMKGMEMEFAVQNAKVLNGLKAGDQVQGHLSVESGKYVITDLEKR